jgi:hypothetical protein
VLLPPLLVLPVLDGADPQRRSVVVLREEIPLLVAAVIPRRRCGNGRKPHRQNLTRRQQTPLPLLFLGRVPCRRGMLMTA